MPWPKGKKRSQATIDKLKEFAILKSPIPKTYDQLIDGRTKRIGACLVWTGKVNGDGYGRLSISGNRVPVHRLAWKLIHGDIPEDMCVCHHCDNPPCIEKEHLFIGTICDNIRDAARKGRLNGPHGPMPENEKEKRRTALMGRKKDPDAVRRGADKIRGIKRPPNVGLAVAAANRLRKLKRLGLMNSVIEAVKP